MEGDSGRGQWREGGLNERKICNIAPNDMYLTFFVL